jgi:hypothetical protein
LVGRAGAKVRDPLAIQRRTIIRINWMASGALYGTTYNFDGRLNIRFGTVFKLTPPSAAGGSWTETVLHSFFSFSNGYASFYPDGGHPVPA